MQRIYQAAENRDFYSGKTYVYKFGVESWLTDEDRPLMVNSPKPWFAGAIRNDRADFDAVF